jgi:hypothetical protein
MNWLDLYNFLHKQANNIKEFGKFDWQEKVVVFDKYLGEFYEADLLQMNDPKFHSLYITIATRSDGENN